MAFYVWRVFKDEAEFRKGGQPLANVVFDTVMASSKLKEGKLEVTAPTDAMVKEIEEYLGHHKGKLIWSEPNAVMIGADDAKPSNYFWVDGVLWLYSADPATSGVVFHTARPSDKIIKANK